MAKKLVADANREYPLLLAAKEDAERAARKAKLRQAQEKAEAERKDEEEFQAAIDSAGFRDAGSPSHADATKGQGCIGIFLLATLAAISALISI